VTHHIKDIRPKQQKSSKAGPVTHPHGGNVYALPVRARRIRIYTLAEQTSLIVGWLGVRRFVYNKGVELTKVSLLNIKKPHKRVG